MNTDFFIDLLHQVKEFENSGAYKPHSNVEDFRLWLNDKNTEKKVPPNFLRKNSTRFRSQKMKSVNRFYF